MVRALFVNGVAGSPEFHSFSMGLPLFEETNLYVGWGRRGGSRETRCSHKQPQNRAGLQNEQIGSV